MTAAYPGGDADDSRLRREAWEALAADIGGDPERHEVLREAAKAARHGDRPLSPDEEHALNAARPQRRELLEYATGLAAQASVVDEMRGVPARGANGSP